MSLFLHLSMTYCSFKLELHLMGKHHNEIQSMPWRRHVWRNNYGRVIFSQDEIDWWGSLPKWTVFQLSRRWRFRTPVLTERVSPLPLPHPRHSEENSSQLQTRRLPILELSKDVADELQETFGVLLWVDRWDFCSCLRNTKKETQWKQCNRPMVRE